MDTFFKLILTILTILILIQFIYSFMTFSNFNCPDCPTCPEQKDCSELYPPSSNQIVKHIHKNPNIYRSSQYMGLVNSYVAVGHYGWRLIRARSAQMEWLDRSRHGMNRGTTAIGQPTASEPHPASHSASGVGIR